MDLKKDILPQTEAPADKIEVEELDEGDLSKVTGGKKDVEVEGPTNNCTTNNVC